MRKYIVIGALYVMILAILSMNAGCGNDTAGDGVSDTTAQAGAGTTVPSHEYTVVRGDSLWLIGPREGVDYLQLAVFNRESLVEKYEERCTQLLDRYRNRHKRGWYCNDRRRDAWANSLKPGDILRIPEPPPALVTKEVAQIAEVVREAPEPIAIVVDDTGSMSEDRQTTMDWYLAIANAEGKKVEGVYLYADNSVERVTPDGRVELRTTGSYENTYGALRQANETHPRSILLITDEEGDDWDWARVGELPPVYGHCLKDAYDNRYLCEDTLERLAKATGGRHIRGVK